MDTFFTTCSDSFGKLTSYVTNAGLTTCPNVVSSNCLASPVCCYTTAILNNLISNNDAAMPGSFSFNNLL